MPEALTEFMAARNWDALRKVMGWHVERDEQNSDVVRLTLPARDGELYIVRCVCDAYPKEAPSVKFVSADGDPSVRAAWPAGDDMFYQVVKLPPACFLCTDLTKEGFDHHPDWKGRQNAWNGSTHTLMDVFNYVQELLKSKNYLGRAS
jgi:hypothetical protein